MTEVNATLLEEVTKVKNDLAVGCSLYARSRFFREEFFSA
jgi:hypothetical protein